MNLIEAPAPRRTANFRARPKFEPQLVERPVHRRESLRIVLFAVFWGVGLTTLGLSIYGYFTSPGDLTRHFLAAVAVLSFALGARLAVPPQTSTRRTTHFNR